MKNTFSFRRSWLDAINKIADPALRAEITHAVVVYGLTGSLPESDSDVVNAMVALIISQIKIKRTAEKTLPDAEPSQLAAPEAESRTESFIQHTAGVQEPSVSAAMPHIGENPPYVSTIDYGRATRQSHRQFRRQLEKMCR